MFSFFNKKPAPTAPAVRVSFVEQLIEVVIALPNANERLLETTKLKLALEELQDRYSVPCLELDYVRDYLSDAFFTATSSKVMLACSTDLSFREVDGFPFEKDPRFNQLEEHLKVRLIRIWVDLHMGGYKRHLSEYKIENQAAFYELEQQDLNDIQKSVELCEKYVICDWKSIREMNPEVLFSR